MKWSWKIGEFRGIGVSMHATFLKFVAIQAADKDFVAAKRELIHVGSD